MGTQGFVSAGWGPRTLLGSVPEPARKALTEAGTAKRYGRGETLVCVNDIGREVFVILEGCVKVLGENLDGNPALIAVRMASEVIGELAYLDGRPRAATVQSVGITRVRIITAAEMTAILAEYPVADRALRNSVTAKLRESVTHRAELNSGPVTIKLARILLRLSDRYGVDELAGLVIGAPLRQEDLASFIGATPQSVRKALDGLRRAGLVETRYRKVIITDVFQLRALATGRAPLGIGSSR